MITLRKAKERDYVRRRTQEVWLTFFPRDVTDPLAGGFGALEGFNESCIPPGGAVLPRPPQDAEIVTYVLSGALAQEDSTGGSGVLNAAEFQHMSTGNRVRHTERNASQTLGAHFFRIALHPAKAGIEYCHEQRFFPVAERRGVLCIVASPDGRKGSLGVHQDALIYSAILDPGQHLVHELGPDRRAWLHIMQGEVMLDGLVLAAGDGVGVTAELAVSFTAREETEVLLVDLGEPPPTPAKG